MARAVAAWERFFFEPQPTSTLALVRIAFGLLILFWGLSFGWDLLDFFGPGANIAEADWSTAFRREGVWGLFEVLPVTDATVIGLWVALMIAAACLVLGYHSRLAALVVFVAVLSFTRRNPFVFNGGDGLVRILSFYLMLAPSGAALSLDRWRKERDQFWEFPKRAPWALRLMQIQVSVVYLSAVWVKLRGVTWNDGTALSYALRVEDLERFPLPDAMVESLFVSNLLTYGTLAIELAIGILVWNRALRPWVLSAGVALHVGIDLALRVGFFSYAVFVLYLAFLSPERACQGVLALRDRLGAFRHRAAAGLPTPVRTTIPEPERPSSISH
jgi:Vitamin K-dependent gamma-carboxylase